MTTSTGGTFPSRAGISPSVDVSVIDRFEIDAEIGRGGMAVVYAALDRDSGQRVALKILNKGVDPDVRARFHREVKAASLLVHPGICRVLAFGSSSSAQGDAPFLAMELVEGHTLSTVAKKWPLVPGVIAAELLRQLLEALACAHASGVVHRDLKPQNVMVTPTGMLKLLDFGIARSVDDDTVTKSGVLVGTPAFMSPEQARCEDVDARSDLFSAALTVAAVVRKNHRFAGAGLDPTQMLMRVAYDPHGPLFERTPHLPLAFDVVIAGLTRLIPDQRYADARTALEALQASGLLRDDGVALLASYLRDPAEVGAELNAAQGEAELAFATDVGQRAGGETACALALHRALALGASGLDTGGGGADVAVRLRVHASKHGMTFEAPDDAKITELLKGFHENPAHPGILKALADRHRAVGAVRHAAIYLWRYVVEKPEDAHAAQQLNVMLEGPSPPSARGRESDTQQLSKRLSTRSIVAGVKTGGLKRPITAAGVPTRAMQRPSLPSVRRPSVPSANAKGAVVFDARTGGTVVPNVVVTSRGEPDAPSWLGRGAAAAVLLCAGGLAFFLIANGFKLTSDSLASKPGDTNASMPTVATASGTARAVDAAERALATGALFEAVDLASEVLQKKPSIEAGRTALWVRARAHAALGRRTEALADCELYLQKATDFDDGNIAAVKKLMSDLRAGSSSSPVLQ